MNDDERVLIWDRHRGGMVRVGVTTRSLAMLRQPVLPGLPNLEFIDYRPGLCALLREHACGQREMTADERAECDLHFRYVEASWVRGEG